MASSDDIRAARSAIAAGCDNPFLERREVLGYVPETATTILDVGCSRGGFGHALRQGGEGRVLWGVEADAEAAAAAAPYYDQLLTGTFPQALEGFEQRFDCAVFNDVLEHMVDPWAALRAAARRLRPDGVVVASVPNVRYLPVLSKLVLRGEWTYADTGVLDRGHLRFFTKRSVVELFTTSGFAVEQVEGINPLTRRWNPPALVPELVRDTLYLQFVVVARPAGPPG